MTVNRTELVSQMEEVAGHLDASIATEGLARLIREWVAAVDAMTVYEIESAELRDALDEAQEGLNALKAATAAAAAYHPRT